MAHHRPFFGRASTSGTTLTSVGQMPVIDEDEEARAPPRTPTTPLRIPQRSYRRSTARGLPPPYAATAQLPPVYRPPYMEAVERKKAADLEAGGKKELATTTKSRLRKQSITKDPPPENKRRSWRFIALLAVLMAIVVGLAVGLTVGLRDKGDDDGNSSTSAATQFPAGSFSFNTTLQKTTTDCTSNPSTWRCYPYEEGLSATFFWIISSTNSHVFTISSTENPFAPSFTNLTMKLIDGNQPTERFVFSFSMDKTVVPSDALTPSNRAARCTFDDTEFEATLWTRRSGNETVGPPQRSSEEKFVAWPGDVEVSQVKKPAVGSPRCEDSRGTAITDVKAGVGECQCLYASLRPE